MEDNEKPKILVVDDEPRNVRLLSMILKTEGYELLEGYSGEEAIEKAETELPDLILLDIMMPRIDGYEVCQKIRENKKTEAIPIVMITALRGLEDKIKALDTGADDFISKPIEKSEVLARVRSSLRVKQLHDELDKANKKLKRQNEILESELIMAREVQEALLPRDIDSKIPSQIEFCYEYIPTLAVGGDFFDVIKISPNVIGVFIADVMGHGAQPALITVLIKTLLSELICEFPTPAELLSELNNRYNELVHHTGIFTSAFYLTIDVDEHNLIFSNAGHPPPLLISQENLEFRELTKESGLALGLYSEYNYQNHESQLEKGDTVLLYTDGLCDISNNNGELFGLENLKSVVSGVIKKTDNSKLNNTKLIQKILDTVDKFTGNASNPDDITVLCLKCKE